MTQYVNGWDTNWAAKWYEWRGYCTGCPVFVPRKSLSKKVRYKECCKVKLLFLSKHVRPDLQVAVAFLCTRVKETDEDDYKKLCRVMWYLESTMSLPLILYYDGNGMIWWWADSLPLILEDDGNGMIQWWADSAFAVQRRQMKMTIRNFAGLCDTCNQPRACLWSLKMMGMVWYDGGLTVHLQFKGDRQGWI
jgi:hypothetical protein